MKKLIEMTTPQMCTVFQVNLSINFWLNYTIAEINAIFILQELTNTTHGLCWFTVQLLYINIQINEI